MRLRSGRWEETEKGVSTTPPTRSPSETQIQVRMAAALAASTDLNVSRVPKRMEDRASMRMSTGRSRSSWNNLVWVRPVRAVTRQSMVRMSSPG